MEDEKLNKLPPHYKWDERLKDQYIQLLTSDAAMQTLGNCWFNYLVWVFQTNEPKAWFYSRWFSDQHKKVVNNYEVFAHSFVEILDKDISEPDVKAAVSKLKCNKSAGNDSIVNEMIKAGAEVLSPTLCKLLNTIFNKGYPPTKWWICYIVPIYKSDGQHDPSNYGDHNHTLFRETFYFNCH